MMQMTADKKQRLLLGLLCAVFVPLGFVLYSGVILKTTGFLAGVGAIAALILCPVKPLRSQYTWPMLGYLAFSALSGFWALSGKTFLESYLQLFTAGSVFLVLLLRPRFDERTGRNVLGAIAVTSGAYALLGFEAATTGLTKKLLLPLLGEEIRMGFTSIRLTGVFGNGNVEASVFALGVIASLARLTGARERRERVLFAAVLSLCASALLLTFSMGALFFFVISMVVYLIFAGETRGAVFARMLEGALPAVPCVLLAARFGGRAGAAGKLPLPILLCGALVTVLLETRVSERVAAKLEKRRKLVFTVLAVLIALAGGYLLLGFSVDGPYTFGGTLNRTFYTTEGGHTVTIEADGEVRVRVVARSAQDLVDRKSTTLCDAVADEVTFTVPEDAVVCTLVLSAGAGRTVNSAVLDGAESISLNYPLLPGSVVSRLQDIRTNSSMAQRREMMRDGMALWRMRPVAGNGCGAFEEGQYRVKLGSYASSRVHNHYIETLLETGVIGLVLWLGALLAPLVLLLRERKNAAHPARWAYGALWAAMTMAVLQPLTDVSFSFCVSIWYAFAIFALILRLYAPHPEEAAQPAEEKEEKKGKKERHAAEAAARAQRSADLTIRAVSAGLIALFLLTVAGCGAAERISEGKVTSIEGRLGEYERCAKLDVYTGDGYRYDYIYFAETMITDEVASEIRTREDDFARELGKRPDADITQLVAAYYYNRGWYDESIAAANALARLEPGKRSGWRQVSSLLASCYGRPDTPLLGERGTALMDALLEYRALRDAYNEKAYTPVVFDEDTEAFFDKVADARAHADDAAYLAALFGAD